MADGPMNWLKTLWAYVDERLAALAETLQRVVRLLRTVKLVLLLAILFVISSGALAILNALGIVGDLAFAIVYAVSVLILVIPIIGLYALVGLPLRWTSAVRLIDQGYPANARELGIRIAARKLRDQSIETEELLVETAVNEGRKAYHKYKARAAELERTKADLDAAIDAAEQPGRREPPSL